MRIKDAPLGFVTGGTLSPRVMNENLAHCADAIREAASYRYAHSVVRLPYHRSLTTGYDQSDSDSLREYVLNLPTRWSVERAYLRYYGTVADTVRIDVYEGSTLVEGEYLTIGTISSADSEVAFNGKRVEFPADTDVKFRLEGSGNFTSSWTFLELHIRTDRFNTSGSDTAPEYVPARITSGDARDADTLNAELTEIGTDTDVLDAADVYTKIEVYVAHDVPDDGSGDALWVLPYVDSDTTKRSLVKMTASVVQEAAPATSTGVTWSLTDDGATSQQSLVVDADSAGRRTETTGTIAESIATESPDLSDPSDGWTLEVDSANVNETVDKTYCVLIYE